MSGGGRQNWRNLQPVTRRELLDDSEHETDSLQRATEIEHYLSEKLKEINDLDYSAIHSHREMIQKALRKEFDIESMNFAGSHARHTDVVEHSDIDLLATFRDKSELPDSSDESIVLLAHRLQARLPKSTIEIGKMAVSVKFSDGLEVQVLPAFREGNAFKIPDVDSSGWKSSNPAAHSRALTATNGRCNGQLIPTIKLAKELFRRNGIELKSYHVESMALKAFAHYSDARSNRVMLRHLLSSSKTLVRQPIADQAGQTSDVSSYLSPQDRTQLSTKLANLETRLESDLLGNWSDSFDA
ncbi:MAG: nucleotidyltransferase [Chloroflexota bacterium]|nr:nucleotidyltransferase [Chloroflexota bacterium]